MSSYKANVAELIAWVNVKHNGRCNTRKMVHFYESHPHLSRRVMGSLRSICRKSKKYISYEQINGESFISTCGRPACCDVAQTPSGLDWTNKACISEAFIVAILAENADVTTPTACQHSAKGLQYYLTRERRKSVSMENRNKLRGDPQEIDRLLASTDSLIDISRKLNIAYSDCAVALLSWEFIDEHKEAILLRGDTSYDDRKLQLLYEALHCTDEIAGYKISGSAESAMRQHSKQGEKLLESEIMRALNLTAADFSTEEDVIASLADGDDHPLTPDVLFKTPQVICGQLCYWAEAKHSVAVPGISPVKFIDDIKKQTDKYVAAFGPGLILWTKCGYCEKIREILSPGILHVVPDAVFQRTRAQQYYDKTARNHGYLGGMRRVSASPNFFTPSHAFGSTFGGNHWLDQLLMPHGLATHQQAVKVSAGFRGIGNTLGGSEDLDIQSARAKLLDHLDAQARLQQAVVQAAEQGADGEDDSFTLMLVRMFTTAEDDFDLARQTLLSKLEVSVRLLRLSEPGVRALTMVSKILQPIYDNPDVERYRTVKIVSALINAPRSIQLLVSLGFMNITVTCISLDGAVQQVNKLQYTGEIDAEAWSAVLTNIAPGDPTGVIAAGANSVDKKNSDA